MYEYKAHVRRIVDGDTVVVDIFLGFDTVLNKAKLRLYGIDTPETYRPSCNEEKQHGLQAKKFTSDMCFDKDVTIKTYKDKKGKYGRYLADVIVDGKSLVQELKKNGFEKKTSYLYNP